jgi:inward rectifier potassium channel
MPRKRRAPRPVKRRTAYGSANLMQLNLPRIGRFNDLYHGLLTIGRWRFGLTILGVYLGVNAMFAIAYMVIGGVDNMAPDSFSDAFFFSVQTMATIGYGRMVPLSIAANSLVTMEAGLGLFGMAVAASLMFSRFTRAKAGVRFSTSVVITKFDGKPTLMFRLANERAAHINEAHIFMVVARQQTTREGQNYRRLEDLEPTRSFSPVFELSWTVMHVIDAASPLFGCTPDSLAESDAAITVVFSGHHEGLQQQVHARHTYLEEQILWDHRFADLISRDDQGVVTIDYSQFDEVIPVSAAERLFAHKPSQGAQSASLG